MTYAFSRDRAIPGWRIWSKVNRNGTPVNAIIGGTVAGALLTLPALYNYNGVPIAFYAVVSVCVIGLYLAFLIPIYLRLRMGDRFVPGPWTLGPQVQGARLDRGRSRSSSSRSTSSCRSSPAGVPFSDDFTWSAVNYAPIAVGGALLLVGLWWVRLGPQVVHRPGPHHRRAGAGAANRRRRVALRARWVRASRRAPTGTLRREGPDVERRAAVARGAGLAAGARRQRLRDHRGPAGPGDQARPGGRGRAAAARAGSGRAAAGQPGDAAGGDPGAARGRLPGVAARPDRRHVRAVRHAERDERAGSAAVGSRRPEPRD